MSDKNNEKIRTEGRTAFDRGAKESECPHEWESEAGKHWRIGYTLGEIDVAWKDAKTAFVDLLKENVGMVVLAVICCIILFVIP